MVRSITFRVQEAVADLVDQLEHAERFIEAQARHLEALGVC